MISLVLIAAVLGVSSAQFLPAPAHVAPVDLHRSQYYRPGVAPYAHHGQVPYAHGQVPYASILRQSQDTSFDGSFNYAYETENGISSQASGILQNPGTEVESQVMSGSYSYTAPDGTPINVNWVADENGFRAEGAHIPQASPEIQRSVAYNLANPSPAPGLAPVAPFRYAGAPIAPLARSAHLAHPVPVAVRR